MRSPRLEVIIEKFSASRKFCSWALLGAAAVCWGSYRVGNLLVSCHLSETCHWVEWQVLHRPNALRWGEDIYKYPGSLLLYCQSFPSSSIHLNISLIITLRLPTKDVKTEDSEIQDQIESAFSGEQTYQSCSETCNTRRYARQERGTRTRERSPQRIPSRGKPMVGMAMV